VIVSLGHGMLMVLGGVLSLLVAQRFGKTVETDAFFAAYAFYGVGLTFVTAFRLTAVAPLLADPRPEGVTRMLGAVAVIMLAMAVPMVALADPVGAALVENDPTGTAAETLRILWVTLAGQLFAAMLGAVLAVRGSFMVIGVASLLSGVVSVVTFLALAPALGIAAAAVGLAASAAWLTACSLVALLRMGWRPTRLTRAGVRAMLGEATRLSYASATFLGATITYAIATAVASRLGEGETTLFAYAFMLATVLVGVTSNVTAMVRSPALVAGDERSANVAAAGVWSFRFTILLVGPVIAMTLLVGEPVIGFALGSEFTDADIQSILTTLLALVVWILASAGSIFAVVELLARGALRRLAVIAAVQVATLAVLAVAGGNLIGIEGVAAATSISVLVSGLLQLAAAFGPVWRGVVGDMLAAIGRELVVLAIAFAPATVLRLVLGDGAAATVLVATVAAVLVVVGTALVWPRERDALLGLLRRAPAAPVVPVGLSTVDR
jgi:peptidoglycan biosynthesis protein MviN/MurJ (putative lipid II flippase)